MHGYVVIFLGFGLVLTGACDDAASGGGAGGTAGIGGAAGMGGVAGGAGGSGGDDCHLVESVCQPLDQAECELQEECVVVEGALWSTDIQDCLAQPREFLACRAGCLESPDVPTCVYEPSAPQDCYCLTDGSVPSGWEELFECQIPEGLCGT